MAVTLFSKQLGIVSSFQDPTLPATTTLNVEGFNNVAFKSMITRVTVATQGNYQFLHTLGGNIYVYVFGDRIGQLGISGLAFDSTCGDAEGTIGIERILQYYGANRIAARKTPMKITIGVRSTAAGYLVGVSGDVVDPKSRIYQFNLQFMMVPENLIPCSVSGSDSSDDSSDEEDDSGDDSQQQSFANPTGTPQFDGSFAGTGTSGFDIAIDGYAPQGTGPNTGLVIPRAQ